MNPLQQLIQMLLQQSQSQGPRQDLGQSQPTSTFAGRVVHPGDTPESAMKQMPMGQGEGGDLSGALQAAFAQFAPQMMQGLASKLAMALMGGMKPPAAPGAFPQKMPLGGQQNTPSPFSRSMTSEETPMYNNLPPQKRSFLTPEDMRRKQMGEPLPENLGQDLPEVNRGSPSGVSAADVYDLWKLLGGQ